MFVFVWTRQDAEETSREKQRLIDDRHLICRTLTLKIQRVLFFQMQNVDFTTRPSDTDGD